MQNNTIQYNALKTFVESQALSERSSQRSHCKLYRSINALSNKWVLSRLWKLITDIANRAPDGKLLHMVWAVTLKALEAKFWPLGTNNKSLLEGRSNHAWCRLISVLTGMQDVDAVEPWTWSLWSCRWFAQVQEASEEPFRRPAMDDMYSAVQTTG